MSIPEIVVIVGASLAALGVIVVNLARTPPAAYIGMIVAAAGAGVALISGAVWILS